MSTIKYSIFLILMGLRIVVNAANIYVSTQGNDSNSGSEINPLLTINKAATMALPGDSIFIFNGTYREFVDPSQGGTSDSLRIVFMALGDSVYLKGSEQISSWKNVNGTIWQVKIPVVNFNGYNPYTLNVDGDFQNYGQWHHRGDVYINNSVLHELQSKQQVAVEPNTWYTQTINDTTFIYANFANNNPNNHLTEINFRELIFFALKADVDFITLDGLRFLHAAPNWQAPNTGSSDPNRLLQVGAVGCNMGKEWQIRNCEIMYSKTAGLMLGESADKQHTFEDIDAFGNHLVHNNFIHGCGQYGIAGQKGITRSHILGNRIEDINYRNEFGGYEPAGIKIWNSVDVCIENNLIQNCIATQSNTSQAYCIWIDYANQGTRITRNVLVSSAKTTTALFLEANIGPTLVDNNLIIEHSGKSIMVYSGGSIFAHNLFVDANFDFAIQNFGNGGSGARMAYTFNPHTLTQTHSGQRVEIEYNQLYNNIFTGGDGPKNFSASSGAGNVVDHNLYMSGTMPSSMHTNAQSSVFDINPSLTQNLNGISFDFKMDDAFEGLKLPYVDTSLVGMIPFAEQSIEDEQGHWIKVNSDFNKLDRSNPYPLIGPIEDLQHGENQINWSLALIPSPGEKYDIPESIPPSMNRGPYNGFPLEIPGVIETEEYDFGGQGKAYNDDDKKEGDASIRPEDMVDMGFGGDNAIVVAWFNAAEWMEYTVNVEPGVYTIALSAASGISDVGELYLSINEENIGVINVENTGDWNTYKNYSITGISIDKSESSYLRITSTGGFNIDNVTFVKDKELGVNDNQQLAFESYPNPANEFIFIKENNQPLYTVQVINMDGRVVLTDNANPINISALKEGVYGLLINGKKHSTFIKQ